MKKNIILKSFLLFMVVSLMIMGFTGCGAIIPIPTTGTVYIVVGGYYWYDVYMDYVGRFYGVVPGTYVLYNVPIGNHFFEAEDIDGAWWGYDSTTQYITAGINYVYLYP